MMTLENRVLKMYGPPRRCKALGRDNDDSCVNVSSLSRVHCYFQFEEPATERGNAETTDPAPETANRTTPEATTPRPTATEAAAAKPATMPTGEPTTISSGEPTTAEPTTVTATPAATVDHHPRHRDHPHRHPRARRHQPGQERLLHR